MTEKRIQSILYSKLFQQGCRLACPNYTPAGWWECDLFAVTKAGYVTEYEIKRTRADFKKDVEKQSNDWQARTTRARGGTVATKHERLEAHDPKGPNRFFYVSPVGVLTAEDIPTWAGWIEIVEARGWGNMRVMKPAPALHKEKVDQKVVEHCHSVFYYRFWNQRLKLYPCRCDKSDNNDVGALV